MRDEDVTNMVLSHDKHLDTLTHSIEVLADNMGATNRKLDDIIEVINTQNVLIERMNNMDENLKESFSRVHAKINKLESTQNGEGCAPLKVEHQKVSGLGRSVDLIKDSVKDLEEKQGSYVQASTARWALAIVLGYLVVFGTYVVQYTHDLETRQVSNKTLQTGVNHELTSRLDRFSGRLEKHDDRHETSKRRKRD